MKKYVAGLMFSEDRKHIALIEKNKPDWQKGLLNGIGGKIEESDFKVKSFISQLLVDVPYQVASVMAMSREFQEETGLETNPQDWELFLTMGSGIGKANDEKIQQYNEAWQVDFYRCFSNKVFDCKTTTDELVHIISVDLALCSNTIDNLKWLIHLALDKNPKFTKVEY